MSSNSSTTAPGRLRQSDASNSNATAALQISVIIPARNEAANLPQTLERVLADHPHEVIVVDGMSSDDTASVARQLGAQVLTEQPGRARQMNAGAAAADGDVLLFLHADTLLPQGYVPMISQILGNGSAAIAGAFSLAIEGQEHRWSLGLIAKFANLRAKVLGMPYGDQAMFVRADAFRSMGGFPDLPILEDYQLVRQLRRNGRRLEIVDQPVVTSARRWIRHGIWRTTMLHQMIVLGYHLGVDPQHLARLRGGR